MEVVALRFFGLSYDLKEILNLGVITERLFIKFCLSNITFQKILLLKGLFNRLGPFWRNPIKFLQLLVCLKDLLGSRVVNHDAFG